MMKRQALVAVAFAVLLSAGALILLVPSEDYDPLAEFRNETGGVTIPGGQFTPELQRLLFGSGPSLSINRTAWVIESSAYPTLSWTSHTFSERNPNVFTRSEASAPSKVKPSDLLKPVVDGVRWFFSFEWLVGRASAVDRFAVYGDVDCVATALATDADCWSTTSGGSTAGLPVAADNLIFDSGTGAGTGTFDASLDITTGTVTTCSAATAPIAACAGAFTGTFALSTFTLTNTGTIVHDGGTITSGTGGIDGGVTSLSGAAPTATITVTGAGTWRLDGLTLNAGGTLTAAAMTLTIDGSFDFSAGTFTFNTSTVVMNTNLGTLTTPGTSSRSSNDFYNLTIADGVTVGGVGGTFAFANVFTFGGAGGGGIGSGFPTIFANSGAATPVVAGATFTFVGPSLMVMNNSASYNMPVGTFPSTLVWQLENNTGPAAAITATLTGNLSSGAFSVGVFGNVDLVTLAVGTNTLTATRATGTFSVNLGNSAGVRVGALTVTSGTVTIVDFQEDTAASYVDFGSSTWTVSGTWTNISTTANWNAGSATVTFNSATGGTMTFAGANLGESEFNNLSFNSTGAAAQTFTMATRGLRIGGTLTVTDTVSTTTLAATTLDLRANSVQIEASGIITTTGDFTNVVTFNIDGSLTMNTVVVSNMYMNRTAGTGTIDITLWTAWAVGAAPAVDVRWTFSPSVAGDTWQFVLEDVVVASSYSLLRNAATVDTQASVGTTVTLSRAAGWAVGDAMQIDEACVGTDRYWVGGTGTWSDTARWAPTSGGASGCLAPTAADSVFFDANSGAGTATVGANAAMLLFNSTGNSMTTIAIVTFNFAVSGSITHAAGVITIGNSAGTGLTATGNLTISGTANINASGAVAIVDIDGDVNISAATAYIDLGSGTWTIGGTWTNSTTSASWDDGGSTVTFDDATAGTMTFAGANLAEDEFNNLIFDSTGAAAQTFTMATRGLRFGGTLTIRDTVASTTELATANLAIDNFSSGTLVVGNGGILTANASAVFVGNVTMTGGVSGVITITTGAWQLGAVGVSAWNTSGAGSTFTEGTGIVTIANGNDATITMLAADNTFDDLTIPGGTVTLASNIVVTNGLIVSAGTLAKNTRTITIGSLTMSGGDLTSTSGAVVVTGNVNISAVGSAIDFGSEAWTVSGTWTNASTDGAVWEAGTGTITFDSAIAAIMTFAGANLAEDEFSAATFASTAAGSITFTMATRGLRLGGALTIDSTSVLAKATFTLTVGGAFTLGAGEANALTSTSGAVVITGAVSIASATAYIDFGSEAWTVAAGWSNISTSATWDAGTGSIEFTAVIATAVTFANAGLAEDEFNAATFSGAATFTATGSIFALTTITVGTAATFNTGTNDMRFDRLDVDGTLVMDGITVPDIDIDGTIGTILLTQWTLYSVTGGGVPDIRWTMDPSVAANNVTVIVAGLTALTTFAVYRDDVEILTSMTDGAGLFTAAGGALNVGWSSHGMIIALPGLVFGGGGGGGLPADPTIDWTWRHLGEDLTVQFVIISPNSGWVYVWLVDGKTIQASTNFTSVTDYQFQLSGKHEVSLKATFLDKSYQTVKVVEVKSISFVGRYLPVLALVLIAMWFVILVLAETWASDSGRFMGILIALANFVAAYLVLQSTYLTFSLTSQWAIQMFAGMAVIVAGAALKRAKVLGMVLMAVGAALLVWVYMFIMVL